MAIFSFWSRDNDAESDMARNGAKPLDKVRIDDLTRKLKAAVRDGESFKSELEKLSADKSISAQELIAIAQGFAGGGKPKSKKAALTAIAQERVRLSHAKAKAGSAAKARAW